MIDDDFIHVGYLDEYTPVLLRANQTDKEIIDKLRKIDAIPLQQYNITTKKMMMFLPDPTTYNGLFASVYLNEQEFIFQRQYTNNAWRWILSKNTTVLDTETKARKFLPDAEDPDSIMSCITIQDLYGNVYSFQKILAGQYRDGRTKQIWTNVSDDPTSS